MRLNPSMKKCWLLFCLIVVIGTTASADHLVTIHTPKGSVVPDTYSRTEMSAASIANYNNYIATNYPNAIQLADSSRTYNCHGYAWHVSEGGSNVWIGLNSNTAEDIYWQDGSYIATTESQATKVSYSGNHSAITTSQTGYYISKWGPGPLVKHYKTYTPGYGSPVNFYKPPPPPPPPPPPLPQNLVITNAGSINHSPNLSWNASTGATSYTIYRCLGYPRCLWEPIHTTTNTSFTDWDVVMTTRRGADERFSYTIKAVNQYGSSGPSNIVGTWGFFINE